MRFKPLRYPPQITTALSWRELYESGAFAQRELVSANDIRSAVSDRGLSLGIANNETLEWLDVEGALSPIAFSRGRYAAGWLLPAEPIDELLLREEQDRPLAWAEYLPEEEPATLDAQALYSPWQMLYVDDVVEGSVVELGTSFLLDLPEEAREGQIQQLQGFLAAQRDHWRGLDEAWRPLIKVVVRLQNYYWPRITERVSILRVDGGEEWIESSEEARHDFALDPTSVAAEIGATTDELRAAYDFLVERGIDREPNDGLMLLRRARPRDWHIRWRGEPRRAQDNFDAAEILRRFLADLSGESPGMPQSWPMDGRQPERKTLYEHGPGASFDAEELKRELHELELYPPGILVVGEGASEITIVEEIVAVLGSREMRQRVEFSDLGGSGAAARIETLMGTLGRYASGAVVIVDREGQMAEYLSAAAGRGTIPAEDIELFGDSLEHDNATVEELLELARAVAARKEAVLSLTAAELESFHADRRQRADRKNQPGIADSLQILARHEEHGAAELEKVALADALAELILSDWQAATTDEEREDVLRRRPILKFVIERVLQPLAHPRPVGRNI